MAIFPDLEEMSFFDFSQLSEFQVAIDGHGRIVACNSFWSQELGWSQEQLVGVAFEDFLAPAAASPVLDLFQSTEQDSFSTMFSIKASDGSWKIVEWFGRLQDTASGRLWMLSGRECGTKQRAYQLLEQTNEVARIGWWEFDVANEKVYWSPMVYKIYGENPDEFSPGVHNGLDAFTEECRPIIKKAFDSCVNLGLPYNVQLQLIHKDGRKIDVRSIGQAQWGQSKAVRVFGTFQDITEDVKLQNSLRQTHLQLRSTLDAFQIGTWSFDIQNKLLMWDETNARLFEAEESQFTNNFEYWKSIIHPEDFSRVMTAFQMLTDKGRAYDIEYRLTLASSKIIWVRSRAYSASEGALQRVHGVHWDITSQKHMHAGMIHNAKLTTIGEMAGGIAHEINNPLAVILGKAQQLLFKYEKNQIPSSEDLQLALKKIVSNSERIAHIVKSLQHFSRSENSEDQIDCSIKHIVQDALDLCKYKLQKSGVQLIQNIPSDLYATCNETQISQSILSLLINSLDAIGPFGAEAWIRLEAMHDGAKVVISVTDSGLGISEQIVDKIMQPFFTTKEVGKGAGLGLSISQGIVEKNKGRLYLDRKSPNTRFVIELPSSSDVKRTA